MPRHGDGLDRGAGALAPPRRDLATGFVGMALDVMALIVAMLANPRLTGCRR